MNILVTMVQKAKIFVFDAGKVIMVISVLLWGLGYFGPSTKRDALKREFERSVLSDPGNIDSHEALLNARLLENSYAGLMGRFIEPLIEPLGFDWKIGIALITSFAAREVFVGTMATLYSVGGDPDENDTTLREKMSTAVRSDGSKVYNLATGVSLMIFYVFAMQCMSTLAVVRRETGGWKWPIAMFIYMTGIAYLLSMVSYWLISPA
jgi:ferrous iron transport protein B